MSGAGLTEDACEMRSKVEIAIELRFGLDYGACTLLQIGLNLLQRRVCRLLQRNAVYNGFQLRTGFQRAVDLASEARVSVLQVVLSHRRIPLCRLTHEAIDSRQRRSRARCDSLARLHSQGEMFRLRRFHPGLADEWIREVGSTHPPCTNIWRKAETHAIVFPIAGPSTPCIWRDFGRSVTEKDFLI